ncbi:MAG TPA: hypothetical protein VGP46_02200 [Acidimicrobiales bacterium]|jgi:chromosome segregation ATPase|nr:hypothetical protein [Acidimicrobiales bacterium]
MDLDTVADELYGLPPAAFTAARDGRAAAAKSNGDRALAGAIKALRRPTVGAWLANLLARSHNEQLTELLALGPKLRQAQQELAGAEVRSLSQERRRLISALAAQAADIAAGAGQRPSQAALQELETTLGTGLVDPVAADLIRIGRVTVALTGSASDLGLGGASAALGQPAEAGTTVAPVDAAPEPVPVPPASPSVAERKQAAAAVAAAEATLERAVRALATSRAEHEANVGELARLQERLTFVGASVDKSRKDLADAEAAFEGARQQLSRAQERAAGLNTGPA